jgi:hypothetical protein
MRPSDLAVKMWPAATQLNISRRSRSKLCAALAAEVPRVSSGGSLDCTGYARRTSVPTEDPTSPETSLSKWSTQLRQQDRSTLVQAHMSRALFRAAACLSLVVLTTSSGRCA